MPMALHYYRQCISSLSDEKCRLSGNVNFQTGYLFLEQGFPNYALPYFRKSLEIEQALTDTAMAVYCLQKIAYSYQDMKSDSCLLYFERALRLADHTRQDWLINEIKSSLATYYLQKGSYGKAKELALPVLRTMEDENPGKNSFYSVVGLSCYGTGQIDSARYYFHKLYDLGDVESKTVASKYLYRIYAKSGDTAKALHYLDEYDQNDDSLKTIKVEASVARMNALFNYTMYKERNEYLEASRMRMIFISVVALLLVALLLVCIYVRMRMLKQRSERQILNLQRYRIETAERRKEFVERKDAEITELRSKLQSLENNGSTAEEIMSRKKVLESRRELAESKQDLEDKRKELFVSSPVFPLVCKRVRENSPLNTEEQNLLDHTLLELMPDFIVNLKSVTYVSIQDIRMCSLIKFCDLHSNEVASLLGRHKSTISKAKKKLLTKFAGSDVSDMSFEEFIRNI